jgi:AbrB family looped-hinge helix DNA binding protein
MVSRLTLDKAGRIVLPKPVRDELQLRAGDTLELESSGEEITLRPARGNAQLHKKRGVWVFRAGEPLTTEMVETAVRDTREERHRQIVGKNP